MRSPLRRGAGDHRAVRPEPLRALRPATSPADARLGPRTATRRAEVTRAPRTAKPAGESLVFRGPPGRLASLLPAPSGAEQVAKEPTASLSGADVRGLTVRTFARAGVDARKVTLRVPTSTAPGTYRGSAEIEGQEIPIVVEVEPRARLAADPRRISVEATPGDTA